MQPRRKLYRETKNFSRHAHNLRLMETSLKFVMLAPVVKKLCASDLGGKQRVDRTRILDDEAQKDGQLSGNSFACRHVCAHDT